MAEMYSGGERPYRKVKMANKAARVEFTFQDVFGETFEIIFHPYLLEHYVDTVFSHFDIILREN